MDEERTTTTPTNDADAVFQSEEEAQNPEFVNGNGQDDIQMTGGVLTETQFVIGNHNAEDGNISVVQNEEDDEDNTPLGQLLEMQESEQDKMQIDGGGDDQDSEDNVPLGQLLNKQQPEQTNQQQGQAQVSDDESEDDVPLGQLLQQKQSEKEKQQAQAAQKSSRKRAKIPKSNGTPKQGVTLDTSEEESSDEDAEDGTSDGGRSRSGTKRTRSSRKGSSQKSSLQKSKSKADREPKWNTLIHNGVIFPDLYTPHGVKMLYDGKPVELTQDQEEVATFYAGMLETDYITKEEYAKIFKKNFWQDWSSILGKNHVIKSLEKCDFAPIWEYLQKLKEEKKLLTKEQKQKIKEDKEALEAKYKVAIVDGREEQVGNFRVEPPGLFRGRGLHPKMGKLKDRIFPEDITLNLGQDAPIPPAPAGHAWKEVRHDNTVTWLAFWKDPINSKEYKYVFLGATSQFKTESDKEKYEKARRLKDCIEPIRNKYTQDFSSNNVRTRQMATALYFIDRLALRAGHEKEEDEADTVGCCTLKVENVFLLPLSETEGKPSIKFDFLGKDSIRYENTVVVEKAVYDNVQHFKEVDLDGNLKKDSDQLFETFDANDLNAELKDLMDGLSVKVFRTYNASILLDDMLRKMVIDQDGSTVNDRKVMYDDANREVAILCNHQRSIPKTHGASMERIDQRLEKLNEELELLQEELRLAKQGIRMDGKNKLRSPESIQSSIEKKQEAIRNAQVNRSARDANKTVALGTSKINYLDPRITVAWCKRNEVPITKVFNKTLLQKFLWAMSVEPDFAF